MDVQTANWIIFIVVCLFLMADKFTTYMAISQLQKNNPNYNYLSAEKNPIARWVMQKCGLLWGNIIFFFVSVPIIYIACSGIQAMLKAFGVANYIGIAWYVIFIILAFTVGNNTYFVLKHSKVLP